MNRFQRSAAQGQSSVEEKEAAYRRLRAVQYLESQQPWLKYSAEYQSVPSAFRTKRDQHSNFFNTDSKNGLYEVRTCSLYMQADQKLWDHIFNHEGQRNYER